MPQLWRMRVANIRYDNSKKVITDELIETHGENTLIQLSNGGGKTVHIQLGLQVVLPNEELNNRKILELLSPDNYTGHVLAEWKLDANEDAFVLTGFCFTKGGAEQGGLKYFMYTHQYSQPNQWDIKNLPLLNGEKYLTYKEMWDLAKNLSKEKDLQFEVFERRNQYVEHLKTFHLYEKEWKNIRNTNTKEGGVDEFFKSVNQTQLFEKIIIPAVEEVIFGDKREEQSLADIFEKHQEKLQQIPEIERNLHAYGLLETGGAEIVGQITELAKQKEDFEQACVYVTQLFNRIEQEEMTLVEELTQAEAEHKDLERQCQELQYQQDSLPYAKLQYQREENQALIDAIEDTLSQARNQKEKLTERLRQMQAGNAWLDIVAWEAKIREAQKSMERESKDNKQDVLLEDLELYQATVHVLLGEKARDIGEKHTQTEQRRTQISRALWKIDSTSSAMTKETGKLQEEISQLQTKLQAIQQEGSRLFNTYQMIEWLSCPEAAVAHFTQKASQAFARQTEIDQWFTQMETDRAAADKRNLALTEVITEAKSRHTSIENDILTYQTKRDALLQELAMQDWISSNLFLERFRLLAYLQNKKTHCFDQYTSVSAECQLAKDQLDLLRGGHYIPNRNVMQFKELFASHDVTVLTGSEWLSGLAVTGEQKEQYLRSNPLLPYSILLSAADFKRVKDSALWKKVTIQAAPVPIMVYGEGLVPKNEISDSPLLPCNDFTYLVWHKGYDCTLSPLALEEAKDELQKTIDKKSTLMQTWQDNIQYISDTQVHLQEFYQAYEEDPLSTLHAALEDTKEKINSATSEKETIEKQMKAWVEQAQKQRDERQEQEQVQAQAEKARDEFEKWQQAMRDEAKTKEVLQTKTARYAYLDKVLQRLGDNKKRLAQKERDCGEKISDFRGQQRDIKRQQQEIPKPSKEYSVYPISLTEATEGYYNCRRALDQVGSRLEVYRAEIAGAEQVIETKKQYIQDKGLALSDVEPIDMPYPQEVIEQTSQRQIEAVNAVSSQEKEWDNIRQALTNIEGRMEQLEETIAKNYGGQKPYVFSDIITAEERIPLRLERIKDEIKDKSQEMAKIERLYQQYENAGERLSHLANKQAAEYEVLSPTEWADVKKDLKQTCTNIIKTHGQLSDAVKDKLQQADKAYEKFAQTLRQEGNRKLHTFADTFTLIEKRYDADYVKTVFEDIFEAIATLRQMAEEQKTACLKEKEEFVRRCTQHAQRMGDEINSIDKCMSLEYGGRVQKAMQIQLRENSHLPDLEMMGRYVDECVDRLKSMRSAMQEERDRYIKRSMSSVQLLRVLYDLGGSKVRLVKPEEHPGSSVQYDNWDVVSKWSGGESYAGCMAVFMAVLTYTRSQMCGGNPYKVLLSDNMFGKASSEHILQYVFQLAKNNNIQLVCYTAHTSPTIYPHFPVVYSLRLRPLNRWKYLHARLAKDEILNIESGGYNLLAMEATMDDQSEEEHVAS